MAGYNEEGSQKSSVVMIEAEEAKQKRQFDAVVGCFMFTAAMVGLYLPNIKILLKPLAFLLLGTVVSGLACWCRGKSPIVPFTWRALTQVTRDGMLTTSLNLQLAGHKQLPGGCTPKVLEALCKLKLEVDRDRGSGEEKRWIVGVAPYGTHGSLRVVLAVTDRSGSPLRMENIVLKSWLL